MQKKTASRRARARPRAALCPHWAAAAAGGAVDSTPALPAPPGELPRAPESKEGAGPGAELGRAYASVPRRGALRNSVLYGDVWERPLLSKRDRSLLTIAVNQALYVTNELRTHIGRGLDENGVTPQEVSEVILHVTFYGGWPAAVNAGRLAPEAFEARGVDFASLE